jgi:hypothetical protein
MWLDSLCCREETLAAQVASSLCDPTHSLNHHNYLCDLHYVRFCRPGSRRMVL